MIAFEQSIMVLWVFWRRSTTCLGWENCNEIHSRHKSLFLSIIFCKGEHTTSKNVSDVLFISSVHCWRRRFTWILWKINRFTLQSKYCEDKEMRKINLFNYVQEGNLNLVFWIGTHVYFKIDNFKLGQIEKIVTVSWNRTNSSWPWRYLEKLLIKSTFKNSRAFSSNCCP